MPFWQMLREWLGRRAKKYGAVSSIGRRFFLALAAVAVLAALLSLGATGRQIHLEVNDVAPRDLTAPRNLIDRPRTEALRNAAAAQIQEVYRHHPEIAEEVQREIETMFDRLRRLRNEADREREDIADSFKSILGFNIPEGSYTALLLIDASELNRMEQDLSRILAAEMEKNIAAGDLPTFQRDIRAMVYTMNYSPELLDFLANAAVNELRPNFSIDEEQTEQNRAAARNAIQPVMIVEGEAIVRQNQRISEDDLTRLREAGLLSSTTPLPIVAGALINSLVLVGLFVAYLYFLRRKLYQNTSRLGLILIIVTGALLLSTALEPISPYLKPIGMVAILLTILIDPVTAVFVSAATGILSTIIVGENLAEASILIAGGVSAVFGVLQVNQRSDIMRASAISAAVQMSLILASHLMNATESIISRTLWFDLMFGGINGIMLTGFLSIGVLPYAENLFGILTSMKLLELSNPNQPLLRRLLLEAPGTYHHSLMVANLAEAATEEVGGNALLVRVGAFYHDIGKVKRPYFFIENQLGGENPHDKISPNLSSLIITAHVREGLEMARESKLPQSLWPFIAEHHGTTVIQYFFHKACEQSRDESVNEIDFRYEGPRPQSRETAILMLADGCEAAVRSMGASDPDQVEATIRKIIRDRLQDRQLDECDLNMRDLDRIGTIFTRVLTGIFHARVEYPEALLRQVGREGGAHDGYPRRRKRA